jgi:hypothetical protein
MEISIPLKYQSIAYMAFFRNEILQEPISFLKYGFTEISAEAHRQSTRLCRCCVSDGAVARCTYKYQFVI